MKMSLRKARKLEQRLDDQAIKADYSCVLSASVSDASLLTTLKEERDLLLHALATKGKVREIKYEIRYLIDQANHECGISKLMNRRAFLISQLDYMNVVKMQASLYETEDPAFLMQRIRDNVEAENTSRHFRLLDKLDHERFTNEVSKLKLEIEEVEDELLKLNHTTKIELSDDAYKVLADLLLVS